MEETVKRRSEKKRGIGKIPRNIEDKLKEGWREKEREAEKSETKERGRDSE